MEELKKGFYWGKGSKDNPDWYDLIIEVHGNFPFLKIRVWDLRNHQNIEDKNPETIYKWGPRIEVPKISLTDEVLD